MELDLALRQQRRDFHCELHGLVHIFRDNKPTDHDAAPDHINQIGRTRLGFLVVIGRDHAAPRHASAKCDAIQRRFQMHAADIFKVTIDAFRRGSGQRLGQLAGVFVILVIERNIDAGFLFEPVAFFLRAGRPDHAATLGLAELADKRADGAGGAGDKHRLAFFRIEDLRDARPRGHARHAEDAEIG